MSYAKALEGILKLFPCKIKVTFIDAATNHFIGLHKMELSELPEQFFKPVLVKAGGVNWQVLRASPENAEDYKYSKKLTLHVKQAKELELDANRFFVPTLPALLPNVSLKDSSNLCSLILRNHEWRQIEFLPIAMLSTVLEEMKAVEAIISPGNGVNALNGFAAMHIRHKAGACNLNIPLTEFSNLINVRKVRDICLENHNVQNGFAISSGNFSYYGTLHRENIKDLCLRSFDSIDEEIFSILSKYELILVEWCDGRIITGKISSTGTKIQVESLSSDPAELVNI